MAHNIHAITTITINKEKLSSRNTGEKKILFQPIKAKNRTISNNFHSMVQKFCNKMICNSKLINRNKTAYQHIKKNQLNRRNNRHYCNYYISGNIFNDYISDYLPEINLKQNEDKMKDKMKDTMRETDYKIEELVNNLKIYPNKRLRKVQSQKIINSYKTDKNYMNNKNNNKNDKKLIKSIRTCNDDKNILINKNNNKQENNKTVSKDHYLYKKIFFYCDRKKIIKSKSSLDNKLNIIYAENEKQYQQNLVKLNEIYRRIGKNQIFTLEPSQSQNKIKALKKRVEFMKRIVDYTYPDMVLTKIKEQESKLNERNKNLTSIVTSKINRNNYVRFNSELSFGLKKSFKIQKYFINAGKKKRNSLKVKDTIKNSSL